MRRPIHLTCEIFSTGLLLATSLAVAGPTPTNSLVAIGDHAETVLNTSVSLAVLENDAARPGTSPAILRVTQPPHGKVALVSRPNTNSQFIQLFQFAARQLSNTVAQVGSTNLYPWLTLPNGNWDVAPVGDNNWISGFFPGALWLVYEQTGDSHFRDWAEQWMAGIAPMRLSTNVDDVGFMIVTSFGNASRITGDTNHTAVLLEAAQSLSRRFNSVVGCLADDRLLAPPPFEVILDTMMNAELLFRARNLGGSAALAGQAASHAEKTMLNHLRPDGSSYHRVLYDAYSGAVLSRGTRAGVGDETTWARGHAWAIYGFTMAWRETGDARFLETAQRLADYYLANVPTDGVPCWDFQAPGIPDALRDSSAAAITLASLVELSRLSTKADTADKYWQGATRIFDSLSSSIYLSQGTTNRGILLHGNSIDAKTDTCLIYGDYYCLEALCRLTDLHRTTALTYTPDPDFLGTDSFNYQVCDSSGATATATVTVSVSFPATISLPSNGHQPTIAFPSITGKRYTIEYRDHLAPDSIWQLLVTNLAGSGPVISFTDTNAPGQRFYRVGMP